MPAGISCRPTKTLLKMNRLLLIITLSLIACNKISAQEVWTFSRCVDEGMKNNPEFQLRQLDILSAETRHRSPALEFLPKIGFTGTHSYSIGSTINPATNSRVSSNIQSDNFSLNANMDLVNFNTFTQARRDKIAILKAKADKEATAAEYQLTVLENYFNVLYSQELLKIQFRQFENAKFNLERIEKEVGIGSKPQSDLYDMQVSYAQEENTITETRQLLYNQKLLLLQLMNVTGVLPNDIVLENFDTLNNPETKTTTEMFENALQHYPKIKSSQLNEAISEKNIKIQKNGYLPVVSAFYSYSSFYYMPLNQPGNKVDPFWTQLNDNKNHYIGLQLSVPIFNGFRNRRDVQLSKIENQQRRVESEQEKIKLRQTIEQETAKREQNGVLAQKLEQTRTFAQQSFETTQSKFTNGLVNAIVFTTSKNQLLTTEYNLLKAKFTMSYLHLKLNFLEFNSFD